MSESELQGRLNQPDDSQSESDAGQEQGGSRQTMGMGLGGDLAGSTTTYGRGVDRQGRPDDPGVQRERETVAGSAPQGEWQREDADSGNLNRNEPDATPGSAELGRMDEFEDRQPESYARPSAVMPDTPGVGSASSAGASQSRAVGQGPSLSTGAPATPVAGEANQELPGMRSNVDEDTITPLSGMPEGTPNVGLEGSSSSPVASGGGSGGSGRDQTPNLASATDVGGVGGFGETADRQSASGIGSMSDRGTGVGEGSRTTAGAGGTDTGITGSSQSPTKGMKTTPLSGNLDQDVVE